jgi:hypothetical protein
MTSAPGLWLSRAIITPSCAEQGTATDRSSVAMTRSRLVESVLVTMVAMVVQPKPSTIGMTARPLRPTFFRRRSASSASRGRYPTSSMNENTRKKSATMGRMIATAYLNPRVSTPYSPTIKS